MATMSEVKETETAARDVVANSVGITNQLLDRHGISEDIS